MTNREFKRLSRRELIDIIYQLQCSERELAEENQRLKDALVSKETKQLEYGSIAEAVVGLSDIFTIAQETADRYLESIYADNANPQKMLDEANRKAGEILAQAQREGEEIRLQAEREAEEKWNTVNKKIDELLRARGALEYLNGGVER